MRNPLENTELTSYGYLGTLFNRKEYYQEGKEGGACGLAGIWSLYHRKLLPELEETPKGNHEEIQEFHRFGILGSFKVRVKEEEGKPNQSMT